MSPSTRGCGLKLLVLKRRRSYFIVTLHARVWIEIINPSDNSRVPVCHPPREGVD